MHFDELEYIGGLKKGDKKIFRKIFYTFYSPLAIYAAKYVEKDIAEEIVQDFMVNLWVQRENLKISTSFKAYLFISIRNRALNALRQKKREQKRYEFVSKESSGNSDFDKFLYRELSENVQKAIDELPIGYRETFKLSRLQLMTNKEIAELQGVSIKAIEYRISQSLKILKVKLRDFLICFVVFLNF